MKNIKQHPLRGCIKQKFEKWGLSTPEVISYLNEIDQHEGLPGCSDNFTTSDFEGIRLHLGMEFDSRWFHVPTEYVQRFAVTVRKGNRVLEEVLT